MLSSALAFLLAASSALSSLVHTAPVVQQLAKRDTAELYIFANCYNNKTLKSYADIFWYYPDFLPDYPEPQATGVVNKKSAVPYAGATTTITTPFQLKAVIPHNATTATVGELVSFNASFSTFAGPVAVFKGSGAVFYIPKKNVNCFEEYYAQDHQDETEF